MSEDLVGVHLSSDRRYLEVPVESESHLPNWSTNTDQFEHARREMGRRGH